MVAMKKATPVTKKVRAVKKTMCVKKVAGAKTATPAKGKESLMAPPAEKFQRFTQETIIPMPDGESWLKIVPNAIAQQGSGRGKPAVASYSKAELEELWELGSRLPMRRTFFTVYGRQLPSSGASCLCEFTTNLSMDWLKWAEGVYKFAQKHDVDAASASMGTSDNKTRAVPSLTARLFDYCNSTLPKEYLAAPHVDPRNREKAKELQVTYGPGSVHGYDVALCQYYNSGKDHIGFHNDAEQGMSWECPVISFSLGQSRRFIVKEKAAEAKPGVGMRKKMKAPLGRTVVDMVLEDGMMLVMGGRKFQENYLHALPQLSEKQLKEISPGSSPGAGARARISLTFRKYDHVPPKEIGRRIVEDWKGSGAPSKEFLRRVQAEFRSPPVK